MMSTRRQFVKTSLGIGAALAAGTLGRPLAWAAQQGGGGMALGLCTYLWGKDWDLPTLLTNCEKAKIFGVELRTEHAHKVEPSLDARARAEVKKRFEDSPVKFVGPGSNEEYHAAAAEQLKKPIENT